MNTTWIKVGLAGLLLFLGSFWFSRTNIRIDSPGKSEKQQQLSGSGASPEVSVRNFLQVLEREDRSEIQAQAVNQEEFERIVFPALPAARPNSNIPLEFVWKQHELKSYAGFARIVADYGGKRFELKDVRFDGQTDYDGFTIHRDTRLLVRDDQGRERLVKMFGSMIQVGNEFKIYSFVVD